MASRLRRLRDGGRREPALNVYQRSLLQTALFGKAAEGDRPARHLHRGDAVLPFMSRLAGQVVNRPRRQEPRRPIETAGLASRKRYRRRGAERYAEDMLEHRPVSVPSDPGTRVVADQQRLDKFTRL